jgi:hypothetical protein
MAWQLDFSSEFATPSIEFVNSPSSRPGYGLSVGFPIDPDQMPSRAVLERPWSKPMPDVFSVPGLNAVSERFRALAEQFEPGMHQFFPLSIQDRDGKPLAEKLYIFNCAVGVDAIIFRNSKPIWFKDSFNPPVLRAGMREKFELSRPAIGDHHIWCGKTVAKNKLFVSDAFYAAVTSHQIRAFRAKHREELEEPWTEEDIAPLRLWEARRH